MDIFNLEGFLVSLVIISSMSCLFWDLKFIFDNHDKLRKERDELWDKNGWSRPNRNRR